MIIVSLLLAASTLADPTVQPEGVRPSRPAETAGQTPDPTAVPQLVSEIKVRAAADVPAGGFATSEELLSALETADQSLRTLEAEVIWTKSFDLGGDRHVRKGKLYFADFRQNDGQESGRRTGRAFAALFDSLVIGERKNDEQKHYIFDGVYIAEKIPGEQKITRSRIAADGKDPLKIGEGPMPIPIGQRKADILSRYDVTLLPAEQDLTGEDDAEASALRSHVANAAQLKLVPKAGLPDNSFREIRLWYRRGTDANGDPQLLPRMARTVNNANDVEVVQLVGVRTNGGIEAAMFDTAVPSGWTAVDR